MIYLNIQVVKGQRTVISLLKEQISNVSAHLRPVPSPLGTESLRGRKSFKFDLAGSAVLSG